MSTELSQNIAHAGLRAPATSGATSVSVELVTGAWPTVPFSALMEDGTSRKEQVTVTGVSGNTLTVTRAQGGTSAVAHDTMSSVDVITTTADLAILETFLSGESVAVHSVDTTAVHGITDTSALALTSALTAHDIDTTSVHGITDTAQVALKNAAQTFTAAQTINADLGFKLKAADTFPQIQFLNGADAIAARHLANSNLGTLYCEFNLTDAGGDLIFRSSSGFTEIARLTATGDLTLKIAGKGLQVKEGSNAKMGVSTLVGGTVVVSNTNVTATSRIFLTVQSLGTVAAPQAVAVTARTAATSFTITSADATDTSVIAWMLVEPSA